MYNILCQSYMHQRVCRTFENVIAFVRFHFFGRLGRHFYQIDDP